MKCTTFNCLLPLRVFVASDWGDVGSAIKGEYSFLQLDVIVAQIYV